MRGRNRRGISLKGHNYTTNHFVSLKGYNFKQNQPIIDYDAYKEYEEMMIDAINKKYHHHYQYEKEEDHENRERYHEQIVDHISTIPEDFMDLKLYLIDNFLIPLAERKFDYVNQNYFNIDWILEEVDKFDYPHLEEEIEFFKRVVEVMQYAATTQLTFDGLKQKLYGRRFGIMIETSRVVLQAPYEVYVIIFGNPSTKGRIFNRKRINDIKHVLKENPGILIEDIREKLSYRYYKYFTEYHREKYKVVHPEWEYESNSDSDSGDEDDIDDKKEEKNDEDENKDETQKDENKYKQ